jgi:hypothetical protein
VSAGGRPPGRETPDAEPISLDSVRNLALDAARGRLAAGYGAALERLPSGRQVFRGIPFDLGPVDGRRFILVDRPLAVELPGSPATHLIVAHLCDAWLDDAGQRPAGVPLGHVIPVGEPLAEYEIELADGRRSSQTIRRRFEVNEGILGWGSGAFAAVPHLDNEVVDWRGPHAAQTPGRYAPAGQSGSLTVMPGTYGGNLVGMVDHVPSATDDALLWLHAIPLGQDAAPIAFRVVPLAGGRPGSDVVIAGATLFRGTADPLVRSARFQLRMPGDASITAIDLGVVIRSLPSETAGDAEAGRGAREAIVGWGHPRRDVAEDGPERDRIVDLSVAADARVSVSGWEVRGSALLAGPAILHAADGRLIEVLPTAEIPVDVEVVDAATGAPIATRVRFTAADGRYLPPEGHADEVNRGFFEDTGADLILGEDAYAYVPGRFSIRLPAGRVSAEAVAGFERSPVRTSLEVDPGTRTLRIPVERPLDLRDRGWVTVDSHVHFLAPTTALLQGAAEDVDVVNLLAAGWGDLFTNLTDFASGSVAGPDGRRRVIVGTENRQNMLGHLALLGARRPVMPIASGGPPEGRVAGALSVLLADWADRCRDAGGLVVAAHFPLPYAEIAADIVSGKIDAVEVQAFAPALDDPAIVEWYRYLNLGDRLPLVAGTDKMSAEVPVGAVRTYVHLIEPSRRAPSRDASSPTDDDTASESWADAVRAGRTFVTSGPLLELEVEGCEPGDVLALSAPGGLMARVRARAAQPVIEDVELLVNGQIVAAANAPHGATEVVLEETIAVQRGAWIAARSRSRHVIESAFTTAMAAHTSPVYVEVRDRPLEPTRADAAVVEQIIEGARTWVATMAAVTPAGDRARMIAFFDRALERLRARLT